MTPSFNRRSIRPTALLAAFGAGLSFASAAVAATIQVEADDHYFQDAVFNTLSGPGCESAGNGAGSGGIDGVDFVFTFSGESTSQGGVCTGYPPGKHIPPGNDAPATTPMASMKSGQWSFRTTGGSFPAGTVLMLSDVDVGEKPSITFYGDCSGTPATPMDAMGFDLVKVSDPGQANWPTMTAPATATDPWVFEAAGNNLNNDSLTSGIVMPAGVCGFDIDATGTSNDSGSFDAFLVKPQPKTPPHPTSAVTPVPTLDLAGLGLLSLLGAGAGALGLRRRQRAQQVRAK